MKEEETSCSVNDEQGSVHGRPDISDVQRCWRKGPRRQTSKRFLSGTEWGSSDVGGHQAVLASCWRFPLFFQNEAQKVLVPSHTAYFTNLPVSNLIFDLYNVGSKCGLTWSETIHRCRPSAQGFVYAHFLWHPRSESIRHEKYQSTILLRHGCFVVLCAPRSPSTQAINGVQQQPMQVVWCEVAERIYKYVHSKASHASVKNSSQSITIEHLCAEITIMYIGAF